MAELFVDSGMARPGPESLSWQEVDAYNRCTALQMSAWEMQQLMAMSRAYCQWTIKGSKQGDIADDVPHIDDTRKATGYLIRQREASAKKAESVKSGKVE